MIKAINIIKMQNIKATKVQVHLQEKVHLRGVVQALVMLGLMIIIMEQVHMQAGVAVVIVVNMLLRLLQNIMLQKVRVIHKMSSKMIFKVLFDMWNIKLQVLNLKVLIRL